MANITSVGLTSGLGTSGTGSVSTLDNLIGTAGTANTNVLTVQGIASGVATPVSIASLPSGAVTNAGTFATQLTGATNNINNVAGTVSLPTGASTSALQTTGNTALTTINTTLGTPMQASGGSVTANAGTNLNTSSLATSTNITGGGQKSQIVDGSGNVIASTSNALNVNISSGVNANGQTTMSASGPVTIASNQTTLSVAADATQLANGATGTMVSPLYAVGTASASGATTLVALVASKKIRVVAMFITANGAVNFNLQSHSTTSNKTGLTYCAAAGDGIVLPYNPLGWFATTSGEALDINLSGSVAVDGYIQYVAF